MNAAKTVVFRGLLCVYLLALWVDQILYVPLYKDSLRTSDVVVGAAFAACCCFHWREALRVACSRVGLVCGLLFAALVAATLAHSDTLAIRAMMRLGVQFSLLIVFGVAAQRESKWFARLAYYLAVAVVTVGATGFVLALILGVDNAEWANNRPAFLLRDDHHLFGNWPRPVGGFSMAAEKFGFWAMLSCAVLVATTTLGRLRDYILTFVAALMAVATLSISASGGLLFAPILAHHHGHKKLAKVLAAGAIAVLLATQFPIHVARRPSEIVSTNEAMGCLEHHPNHLARAWAPEDRCFLIGAGSDNVLTRYGLAKLHAFEVWKRSPLFGEGLLAFRHQVDSDKNNNGRPMLWAYGSPHSAIAGTASDLGLLGLLLLVALGMLLVRGLRRAPHTPIQVLSLSLALAGFAAASFSQDAHKERLLWIVVGYATGLSLSSPRKNPGVRGAPPSNQP